jgi:DNA recombination protein RmuC
MVGMIIAICVILIAALTGVVLYCAKALFGTRVALAQTQAKLDNQLSLEQARNAEFSAQRQQLKSEFSSLASEILIDKQSALARANEDSVRVLFSGLKERLDKYEEGVASVARINMNMGAEMKSHVDSLQKFATEARSFVSALIGGNKIQGNKGEEILANILQQSGLKQGIHYDVQTGMREEGRPDVSIYDVRNSHVILVDSKMNIKDYISAYNLPDDAAHKEEKSRALKAHVASIKRQVDILSSKDYANKVTPKEGFVNLPLVAMFCPFDTILEAALVVDPTLVQYAYERNIVFVTPLTLWGYLWLVSWGWKQREVERKYDEIQSRGRDVVNAVDALLNDISAMGDALEKAHRAYDSLYKRATLEKGQMSIKRVAKNLLEYGVQPKGRLKRLDKEDAIAGAEDIGGSGESLSDKI